MKSENYQFIKIKKNVNRRKKFELVELKEHKNIQKNNLNKTET